MFNDSCAVCAVLLFSTVFVSGIDGGSGQLSITALLLHRKALDEEQQRVAFYPGSDTKFQRFKKAFQGVEEHGAQPMQTDGFKTAPWLLKTGLTPQEVGHGNTEMHTLCTRLVLQSASPAHVW